MVNKGLEEDFFITVLQTYAPQRHILKFTVKFLMALTGALLPAIKACIILSVVFNMVQQLAQQFFRVKRFNYYIIYTYRFQHLLLACLWYTGC